MAGPGWQTDELAEEWVEEEDSQQSSSSISLTEDIGSLEVKSRVDRDLSDDDLDERFATAHDSFTPVAGTFLVREEVAAAPLLPKTPGKGGKTTFTSMFTPLALERMFDPPTPPSPAPAAQSRANAPLQPIIPPALITVPVPSASADTHLAVPIVQITPDGSLQGSLSRTPAAAPERNGDADLLQCQFTFTVPRQISHSPFGTGPGAQAHSTPGPTKQYSLSGGPVPPNPPSTDPRLRLFQFQYDTFTREHLSAIVDSIAVNTPSGGSTPSYSPGGSSPEFPHGLSKVSETSEDPSFARLRSAKRLKLSPATDISSDSYGEGEGAGAVISRPKAPAQVPQNANLQVNVPPRPNSALEGGSRRDYVSESRSLMQRIKAARDFSTVSTVVSIRDSDEGNGTRMNASRRMSNARDQSTASRVSGAALTPAQTRPAARPPTDADTVKRDYQFPPPSSIASTDFIYDSAPTRRPVSSLAYRQQAMDLMTQIRNGSKRLFSNATLAESESNQSINQGKIPGADFGVVPPMGKENAPRVAIARVDSFDAPAHSSGTSASTAVRTSSSSIPGFVFTSRAQGGKSQQQRKRIRLSTEPDDVVQDLAERVEALCFERPPVNDVDSASSRRHDTLALAPPSSPSPTLSAFPLPPSQGTVDVRASAVPAVPNAGFLAAPSLPAYPTASVRARTADDMNRFVSSSTVASAASGSSAVSSGTTLTAATSVGSFTKHPGPAHEPVQMDGPRQRSVTAITQIKPEDVGVLPDKVGRMVYDHDAMRWIKENELVSMPEADGTSDDPFRDIESLRDDQSRSRGDSRSYMRTRSVSSWVLPPRPDERPAQEAPESVGAAEDYDDAEPVDKEEVELNSFSFDESGLNVVQVMTGVEEEHPTTDTDDDSDDGDTVEANGDFLDMSNMSSGSSARDVDADQVEPSSEAEPVHWRSTVAEIQPLAVAHSQPGHNSPLPAQRPVPTSLPPPTPVLRPTPRSFSVTPTSALKDPAKNRYVTPVNKPGHRRSVSFSDGKREGPIRGLVCVMEDEEAVDDMDQHRGEDQLLAGLVADPASAHTIPSARSKRITEMLQGFDDQTYETESPSKLSSGRPQSAGLQPLTTARWPTTEVTKDAGATPGDVSKRAFSRSQSFTNAKGKRVIGASTPGNATFLTDCSFGVTHDKLVQVITDIQPFEPYWEQLRAIDLSKKKLDGVARLKEFLPKLDSLTLNSNQISYLSGVPRTVRTLSVASNTLTSMTSFNHLLNIENLDISHNELVSLRQLACLPHLRELKADGNRITDLDGLQNLDGLVKLSLQGNLIHDVELTDFEWSRMEMLNLSENRIESMEGLSSLSALIALNLDHNNLSSLIVGGSLPRLRILRLSSNKLQQLNVAPFLNLRTLYADNNSLGTLHKANRLSKLENLSLRNQNSKGLNLSIRDVRDIKRLYLSGNPMSAGFIEDACYNLVYLELAACRLKNLPPNMAQMVPNLRVLNLNYNFIDDLRPLEGLARLKKLTVIGSRVEGTKPLIRCVRGMPDVEMLDFRMNPCTLGWYLPLLVRDVPAALQPSEGKDGAVQARNARAAGLGTASSSWQDLDAKFRRDLPAELYAGRLAYRGLIMRSCPAIRMLDGVEVGEKEKEKAGRLLAEIFAKRPPAPQEVGTS